MVVILKNKKWSELLPSWNRCHFFAVPNLILNCIASQRIVYVKVVVAEVDNDFNLHSGLCYCVVMVFRRILLL